MPLRDLIIEATYLAASVMLILGLRSLTRPEHARRGMHQAMIGMALAIAGTLVKHEIVEYQWIIAGLVAGTLIAYPLGMFVRMTAMPELIAISHMFGAIAAVLVGVAEYYNSGGVLDHARMTALAFDVMLGSLTITGSFMAFLKLHELMPARPIVVRGQNAFNITLCTVTVGLFFYLIARPEQTTWFYTMLVLGLIIGVTMVLPIGSADMPVVVSLLNSYAGLASAATGFAIGNNVLIIAGALPGTSGFVLSILMSKAMNRSFANVIFGAFGSVPKATKALAAGQAVTPVSIEDAALRLAYAPRVIIVPGYGMAVAQSQHVVRELAELIEQRGGDVKYAIHPVAGRMPGHMNVLLAEADVPYDRLYDMEQINGEFEKTDVVLVIGANDVVNPAARTDPSSPIYGMPILNVDRARSVIVMKRGMNPGFAGIENELFYNAKTSMLFGDAKTSLTKLVSEVKNV
jgi:H+-translocating NAD(P) transhydrogenase subunit beta